MQPIKGMPDLYFCENFTYRARGKLVCNNGQVRRASARCGAGEAGQGKDRASCGAGREAENAKRRERESDVEKNGLEEPLQEAASNVTNKSRRKEAE